MYVIVSDTSALIFLTKIGKLSLLQEMYKQVFITEIVASEKNLPCIGVLGVLLQAKREGRILELKSLLLKLKESGMWITEKLFKQILYEASEDI